MTGTIEIHGAGLAGCCLAWQLAARGARPRLVDPGWPGAASRVAAGLVNPVTGKNFQPSWRLAEFLPEAVAFYQKVGRVLGRSFWHPMPVHRRVEAADWPKVARKLQQPGVARWVERVDEACEPWRAEVILRGGGRLDVPGFCEATAAHFGLVTAGGGGMARVRCGGAADLLAGCLGEHRCAKGEILTVRLPETDPRRILVGAGGWLVPVGEDRFKAGATYEWDQLDDRPTPRGRERVEAILTGLGQRGWEVLDHQAGVRPIVRRSMPLIGRVGGDILFNGLGSKGSVYAPGTARRLADALVHHESIEDELDAARWLAP